MLTQGDTCSYREFLASEREPGLVFDYIPSLVAVCLNVERKNGETLSETQFEELRLSCGGIVVPLSGREEVWQERYPDIRDYADYLAASAR